MRNPTYVESDVVSSDIPSALTTIVPAVGRALISALFVLSGFSKLAAPAMTIEYIESVGLPLPSIAFGLAAFVEIVGGITLLLGYRTRMVASALFLFVVATAVFFHRNLGDPDQLIHFFKNMAIAGGLMHVVAFGGGRMEPRRPALCDPRDQAQDCCSRPGRDVARNRASRPRQRRASERQSSTSNRSCCATRLPLQHRRTL